MKYRQLGNTDLSISELSFGTWAIGGSWGEKDDKQSLLALEKAIEAGVNFFDTADVYGDGHSEELLAQATKGREDDIYVASKFCRAGNLTDPTTYNEETVRTYLENTLTRLKRERLDLYQIHCPPKEILEEGSVFRVLDKLQAEGKIRYYGVSVESIEEGLICLEQPNVRALQVIFNVLRQKPLDNLLPLAKQKGVGILARVPLASGLLTGKFTKETTFAEDDHRKFNRHGEAFNVGETFGGLELTKGVDLVNKVSWITEGRESLVQASLRWVLDQEEVSAVIPGFKNVKQVQENLRASNVRGFTIDEKNRLKAFYDEHVHDQIRGVI